MIQSSVFLVTVVLMLVVVGVFAFVAINGSKAAVDYTPLQQKSYGMRTRFFWTLIVVGIPIAVISTLDLPFAATRGDIPTDAIGVDVEGRQWFWQVSKTEFNAGDTLAFNVSAADVTHGLGVYNPTMRMLGQTQAMPGYNNVLLLTLNEPGTYKLMCMEYCGLAHHAMISEITVSEPGAQQ